MKIYFENIRSGWGQIRFFHKAYREISTFNSETGETCTRKEEELEYTEGKFSVSYIEDPIAILQDLKLAAISRMGSTIQFDCEGYSSTIVLNHIAGEWFEMLWRNDEDEFGGISNIKASEIISAIDDLNGWAEANRPQIDEKFWMIPLDENKESQ